jgi:streptogramin lyase
VPKSRWSLASWSVYPWKSHPHTLEVDKDGRLVILADVSDEDPPTSYKSGNRDIVIFDPQTEQWDPIVTKCDTHTLRIDQEGRYWLSGSTDILCMYDPATKTERHWPLNVKGFVYGIDVAPDGSVWLSQPFINRLGHFDPRTGELTQREVPAPGFGPRRIRTDSRGRVWLPLLSGHLGVYDPATQKFQFWSSPGPQRPHPPGAVDYHYNLFVDRTGNAGTKDRVYISGTESDSIIAFDPDTQQFTVYRVPTLGFFVREFEAFDGGVWTVYSSDPAKHVEKDLDQTLVVPRLVRLEVRK